MKIAVRRALADDAFLCESPENIGRGPESTRYLTLAKVDFADQTAVDDFVSARGGPAGAWVCVDLAGVGTAG